LSSLFDSIPQSSCPQSSCPPTIDLREWLLTNRLGSFANGTICDVRTRASQGWLIASLNFPNGWVAHSCSIQGSRYTLLLSHLDASLDIAGTIYALNTNLWHNGDVSPEGHRFLESFLLNPVPTWRWQTNTWTLTRQIIMPHGSVNPYLENSSTSDAASPVSQVSPCVLVHYCYQGDAAAILRLRLVIGDRGIHQVHHASSNLQFSQCVGDQELRLQALHNGEPGTPWSVRWSQGHYQADATWYWNFHYSNETQPDLAADECLNANELRDHEDLYSPGYLTVELQSGEAITVEARADWVDADVPPLDSKTFYQALQAEQIRLQRQSLASSALLQKMGLGITTVFWQKLLGSIDQFVTVRSTPASPTFVAAYPQCRNSGRDALIALPGIALTTNRFPLARSILALLGNYCYQGLIPHRFTERGGKPIYTSIDTSLWWIETLGLYLEASQDWDFLVQHYPIVKQIYKAFTAGTLHNIRVDASDELLTWSDDSAPLTWMDALVDGQPVTPRCGKPIEVNALWYSSLCWAAEWADRLSQQEQNHPALSNQARRYRQQAEHVKQSLQRFWNPESSYLLDGIEPDDRADPTIRPNAVIALSLRHCAFSPEQARRVLQIARDRLLTPYGLRSLDPTHPNYVGHYDGNISAHQGTVWSWLLGPFLRAWHRFCSDISSGFEVELLVNHFEQEGCLNAISELFDGDPPHTPRGAIATGVTIAELLRVGCGR
jgi:predicted glycogen debranching enzyme